MAPHFDDPDFALVPDRTAFYFVRHGESEANRDGVIQGRLDASLSDVGRSHAESAAKWFADKGVDLVLSSPLRRAMETARPIGAVADGGEVVALQELVELDTGVFSGKKLSEIEEENPAEWLRFQRYSWESVPEAERIASLQNRARRVWRRLVNESVKGRRTIVSVTHGGMIQWLIRGSFGRHAHAWMPIFTAKNCGIFRLVVIPAPARDSLPASFFAEWQLMNLLPYDS